jgi:ATP-dependent Lon protease
MPKNYNTRNSNKQRLTKKKDDSSDEENWESESEFESDSDSESESEVSITNKKSKKSKKRVIEDSDDSDYTDEDMPAKDVFDPSEYKKFLAELFPSKYSKEEAKKAKKETSSKSKKTARKERQKKKKQQAEAQSQKETEVLESDDDNSDDSELEKDSSDESGSGNSIKNEESSEEDQKKINIIFTLGAPNSDQLSQEEREAYELYDPDEEEEDDDDECDTEDEETFMKESFERIDLPNANTPPPTSSDENSATKTDKKRKSDKNGKQKKNKSKHDGIEEPLLNIEPEYKEMLDLKKDLMIKYKKNPNNRILRRAIKDCTKEIHDLVKTARTKNTKEYKKLIHGGSNYVSEVEYFKTRLSNKEQLQIMEQMKKINEQINIDKPYRLSLLQSNIPAKYKSTAMQKLNILRTMESSDPEYYKMKNWVDTFMRIPFCQYKNLSVSLADGLESCHNFMQNAKQTLDDCVYGLDDAKLQILQMVGQWVSNPSAMGTAIAIKGPPGTGKTSLVKEGISKILGREFAFIALGGAGDSSFLEGHSYTYEGSTWGRIVQILIDSKCMNPVIYFDELDKISDTPRGQEIVGILTHLTDTSQNTEFHDKYFSDVAFDLSKCLFIFSYNDEALVNPILKDRMYRIQTKGYDVKEKTIIAQKYLLPKIREQVNFTAEEVIIPDDTIQYIVSTPRFTRGEDGVRNLKRCLEIIHTKLNLFRLVKSDDNIFAKDIGQHVEFPFTVLRKHVDVFIKNEETQNQSLLAMYI